jgi:hypothetical protein
MSGKQSDFDLDFRKGREGELYVEDVVNQIGTSTIEVKRDLKWLQTGNVYIETECFYQTSGRWEPSGLSVTKADFWAFVLERAVLVVPTNDLRRVVEAEGTPIETDIEPNPSRGYLIRPEYLFRMYRLTAGGKND